MGDPVRYVVAEDVAWVESLDTAEPRVTVAPLPDGPPAALHGTSALIWLAAVDLSDADAVVRSVATGTGEQPETVRADVVGFLEQLVGRGLLARA